MSQYLESLQIGVCVISMMYVFNSSEVIFSSSSRVFWRISNVLGVFSCVFSGMESDFVANLNKNPYHRHGRGKNYNRKTMLLQSVRHTFLPFFY